jgi:O-antigen/teichoic acid export membrane protein
MPNEPGASHVRKNAILLASAAMVEFGLQFLVPVVLVRSLSTLEFSIYRLMMLTASTAMALAPAFMPQSLYYLLPAASKSERKKIIGNVIVYLTIAGGLVAFIASPLNPIVGGPINGLFWDSYGASSLYLWMFVVVSLSTVLPIAEGNVLWQVRVEVSLAIFRTIVIVIASLLSHQASWVIVALMIEMILRVILAIFYVRTRSGITTMIWDFRSLAGQLRFSVPFAIGGSLFVMRTQCDQWLAASLLSQSAFAAFTIGAVVLPIASLIRQPINNAVLPAISLAIATKDYARVQRLLTKASRVAAVTLVPISGILFLTAPEIISLVYTQKYRAALPVMQAYLVGIAFQAIATGYALPALGLGKFALKNNAVCLILSVVVSSIGAVMFGLVGACLGSVVTFLVSELWNLRALTKALGIASSSIIPIWSLVYVFSGVFISSSISHFLVSYVSMSPLEMIASKTLVYCIILVSFLGLSGGWVEFKALRSNV